MSIDWATATPEQRREAVLNVLPLHWEDSNGISARDVAHRVGIGTPRPAARVAPVLYALVIAGLVRANRGKGSKVYWRVGEPK